MIVDIHMHLGDFLHKGGAKIIEENRVFPRSFTIQSFEEKVLGFNSFQLTRAFFAKYDDCYTESVQKRIFAGTFGNLEKHFSQLEFWSKSLFGDTRVACCCMPIAPNVNYIDLKNISEREKRLYPFSSIDPSENIEQNLKRIKNEMDTCYGIKLHPIIQGIAFDSELVFSVLDVFRITKKPVLFHAGASRYYLGDERFMQHCDLDSIESAYRLVKRYPTIPFIIGHAGIAEYCEWGKVFGSLDNVFFDVTVQSVSNIKRLLSVYGEDKILFASDWPCVDPKVTFKIVRKALSEKQLEKCMYKNAVQLVNIGE